MRRTSLCALVGAALFVLPSAAALAADMPQIPPPPQFGGGWYLRGDIGIANQAFKGLSHPAFDISQNDGNTLEWLDKGHFAAVPTLGLGFGYRFSDHVRFDVTGEYRSKSDFHALDNVFDDTSDLASINSYTGKKSEWLFLANAYWDFNSWHNITPYIGAGIGASLNTIHGFRDDNLLVGGGGWAPTGHKWSLAWALHAGAGVQLTNNLTLDLGYSFVSLGDGKTGSFQNQDPNIPCIADGCPSMTFKSLYSHDFKVGFRYAFDKPAYYPSVVKY